MDGDAVRALARRDARQHFVGTGIDGEDGVRILRSNVRAAAVRKEADAAWPRADLDLSNLRALVEVDHLHRVAVLSAPINNPPVHPANPAPRILPFPLDGQ